MRCSRFLFLVWLVILCYWDVRLICTICYLRMGMHFLPSYSARNIQWGDIFLRVKETGGVVILDRWCPISPPLTNHQDASLRNKPVRDFRNLIEWSWVSCSDWVRFRTELICLKRYWKHQLLQFRLLLEGCTGRSTIMEQVSSAEVGRFVTFINENDTNAVSHSSGTNSGRADF